jgi:hypothetical protein
VSPRHYRRTRSDLVQKLLILEALIDQTGMYRRSNQCAASAACTRNPLFGRDSIGGVSWVDLASAGASKHHRDEGRQEIRVWKRELEFRDKKIKGFVF